MKDPLIGQQLANFRVDSVIGHGGMATVYRGLDVKLQRAVAIKVIDRKYKNDPAYAKRFVNEARMMAKWRHENIIQIYYADEAPSYSYYVMEYVDGQDLASVMDLYADQNELMPVDEVLRVGNAVANALDYAHRQGVIHRDVKPSNILIAKDGRVLLGDFGMALEVSDGSMGNIFGTPHYISPEQARRSADAIPQSDIYSLGVILYEILTGAPPFNDPSPASIALQHISQPPPPPRSINPELSKNVEAVLLKALEKDPHNRYQSGAKLMAALADALKSKDEARIPLPPLPVGVPTVRRNSSLTISQITKRDAQKLKGKAAPKPKEVAPLPATVRSSNQRKKGTGWVVFILLLLIGLGAWYFFKNGSLAAAIAAPSATASPSPTPASLPTDATGQPIQTLTLVPATALPETPTAIPTFTPTLEPSPTPELATVTPVATIKYPDGNHFELFWNETSFHMHNLSRQPRSLSAFVFERIGADGNPTDRFYGFRWEKFNTTNIGSKGCVSIKIYGDEDPPYLDPRECYGMYLNIVQPRKDEDRDQIFWNPKDDGSHEFRILFAKEEIARCEISAGYCEFYIP